jgi:hypothetical protein
VGWPKEYSACLASMRAEFKTQYCQKKKKKKGLLPSASLLVTMFLFYTWEETENSQALIYGNDVWLIMPYIC